MAPQEVFSFVRLAYNTVSQKHVNMSYDDKLK